jgi:hypothetical protein
MVRRYFVFRTYLEAMNATGKTLATRELGRVAFHMTMYYVLSTLVCTTSTGMWFRLVRLSHFVYLRGNMKHTYDGVLM